MRGSRARCGKIRHRTRHRRCRSGHRRRTDYRGRRRRARHGRRSCGPSHRSRPDTRRSVPSRLGIRVNSSHEQARAEKECYETSATPEHVRSSRHKATRYRNADGMESFAVRRNNRWRTCDKWLDGQITSGLRKSRQACSREIFRFSEWQIRCINCPSPRLSGEDETRSSRIVGAGCDGRCCVSPVQAVRTKRGSVRRSRVVLASRPWRLSGPPVRTWQR